MNRKQAVFSLFVLALWLAVASDPAMATVGSGGSLPYESWFTSLRNSVTGPYAYTVALIGIVIAGSVLVFGGDMNGFWRAVVVLILVISLLIGANAMMADYFGRGALLVAAAAG